MKLLLVVSHHYNPRELWNSISVFKDRGVEFDVVSSSDTIIDEESGAVNQVRRLVSEVNDLKGYSGLVIISGNPKDTELYWYDAKCQALVQEAGSKGLVVAAICAAVPTIRNAASGRRVSYFPLIRSRSLLEEAGVILSTVSLETDGKVITAETEAVTTMWATNIVDVLENKQPTYSLQPSSFKRKLRERRPIPELEHLKNVINATGRSSVK